MSKTPAQILVESQEAVDRFTRSMAADQPVKKKAKPKPQDQRRRHMAVYFARKKAGLQPLQKPWDFLCSAEVKDMALQAYRVAAWYMTEDVQEGSRLSHQELREAFASSLAEMFSDAIMAHAVREGECWPVTADTPPYRNYPKVWQNLVSEVPVTWGPHYPLYQKLTPASDTNASGAVTNIDEGNVDGTNCSS